MSIPTSKVINHYYRQYSEIDVTFTKEVIRATALVPEQVYLKCAGQTWPCVIYSSSLVKARVIVNAKSGILESLQNAKNLVQLRFGFLEVNKQEPFMFFVSGKSTGYNQHGNSPDFVIISISYSQRPPDDLVAILGRFLDANVNSARRKEERILLEPNAIRELSLITTNTIAYIQGLPRKCILRDISFSGAKIIIMGITKFLIDREIFIKMEFDDPAEVYLIKGRSMRGEEVERRKDLVALGVSFEPTTLPMTYKMRLNDYLNKFKIENRIKDDEEGKEDENG